MYYLKNFKHNSMSSKKKKSKNEKPPSACLPLV